MLGGAFTPLTQTPGGAPEPAHQQPTQLETKLDEQPRQMVIEAEVEAEGNDGNSLEFTADDYRRNADVAKNTLISIVEHRIADTRGDRH